MHKTFWKIFKIGMLINSLIALILVIIFTTIKPSDNKKSISMDRFIDAHAYDKFQVVLYPHTDKQKLYFCYEYHIEIDCAKTVEPVTITLYDMQGNVTDELRVPRSECEVFETAINIDDAEVEE